MLVKIFKGVWFLSLLTVIGVMMYVYASLPESVRLNPGAVLNAYEVSRTALFYVTLIAIGIINALVFVVGSVFPSKDWFFRMWTSGLVGLLNLFAVVSMQFISLVNSQEKFDYPRLGYIIYGTVALVIVWAVTCPVYYLSQRFSSKGAV